MQTPQNNELDLTIQEIINLIEQTKQEALNAPTLRQRKRTLEILPDLRKLLKKLQDKQDGTEFKD